MSGILTNSGGSDKPAYTDLQINTAVKFLPVPIILGWGKASPNLIDYTDFTSKGNDDGGKGGGGSSSYSYTATIAFGLCEGFVRSDTGVIIWKGTDWSDVAQEGMTLFQGGPGQEPWSYMLANHVDRAFAYRFTAYLAVAIYALGDSPDTPNINVLVYGPLAGTGVTCTNSAHPFYRPDVDIGDADPVEIVATLLTNGQFGVPDFPASAIDTASWYSTGAATSTGDAAWQTYCWVNNIGLSLVLSDQETASDIIQRLAQLTNTALFWSEGRLKAVPYGDSVVGGNGKLFVPNVTPIYNLSSTDFVRQQNKDPLTIARVDPADIYNCYRVEWTNCYNVFNVEPMEAKEQSLIEDYGLRVAPTIQGHEITQPSTAQIVADLIKQRGCYILRTFRFTLSAEYFLLEPMDLVTVTDPDLGLSLVTVRITAIEEDDQGQLAITAEEFPAGVATAALYATQGSAQGIVNTNIAAGPVNPPIIFEPIAGLASNQGAEIWIAASGGIGGEASPDWGGCNVHLSRDNVTYKQEATIDGPARQGVLTAALPAYTGTGLDTLNTLTVSLAESGGTLLAGSFPEAVTGASPDPTLTLCYLGGELLAYETATLITLAISVTEAQTIAVASDLSTYSVIVNQAAHFMVDGGVTYAATGVALTQVSANPNQGQYAVASSGTYTFNALDNAAAIEIAYSYLGAGYQLTGLLRGLYGTAATAHAVGAQFARLDSAIFKYTLPEAYVGQTLYIKLVSFNAWGKGDELISDVEPVIYVPLGTGFCFSTSPFLSLLYNGASLSLGNLATPITNIFNCGDPVATAVVQTLVLPEL